MIPMHTSNYRPAGLKPNQATRRNVPAQTLALLAVLSRPKGEA